MREIKDNKDIKRQAGFEKLWRKGITRHVREAEKLDTLGVLDDLLDSISWMSLIC